MKIRVGGTDEYGESDYNWSYHVSYRGVSLGGMARTKFRAWQRAKADSIWLILSFKEEK